MVSFAVVVALSCHGGFDSSPSFRDSLVVEPSGDSNAEDSDDSLGTGDTGSTEEEWPELGMCGGLRKPLTLTHEFSESAQATAPDWRIAHSLDYLVTAPADDDGDCPAHVSAGHITVDAGDGCTNDSGTYLSGSYELDYVHTDTTQWTGIEYYDWLVDYSDADGFVSSLAVGTLYYQWLPSETIDHQISYRVHSTGAWVAPMGDTRIVADATSYKDGRFQSWAGYAYVVEAPWTDGSGDYCVEAEWDWSGGCDLEPDGELLLEADHDYRWVLDG